ncbi:MAG: DUF2793 domain-containing protein [Paracoccaceae bacterium]|nr:MAG: DUF2793 domain-containing protein [Paracoccaceae bacterium]
MDRTPLLDLPYILAAQAQKHVTHNEALRVLDLLVQPTVLAAGVNAPPEGPDEDARYLTGDSPVGPWAGQPGRIAFLDQGTWQFLRPQDGWAMWVLDRSEYAIHVGGAWRFESELPLRAARVGVATEPDDVNRLAVAGDATLLTHGVNGGHQVKINKAAASGTASLLFQTGFSGRAEMGTVGSDGFAIKVSTDGASFAEGLRLDPASGAMTVPAGMNLPDGTAALPGLRFGSDTDTGLDRPAANQIGLVAGGARRAVLSATALQLDVPLTGTAVTQNATDATAGRVTRVGDFALGGHTTDASASAAGLVTRFLRLAADEHAPDGTRWHCVHISRVLDAQGAQIAVRENNHGLATRQRSSGGTWSNWNQYYGRLNILGSVSQSGGVPGGALIEAGSNANGRYRRHACGFQQCWRSGLAVADATISLGALFRSADVTWTFPIAFEATVQPVVTGAVDDGDCWITTVSVTHQQAVLRVVSPISKGSPLSLRVAAVGGWTTA